MFFSTKIILLILCGYISGSIPFGYIAPKILKGIDIRQYGSGNPGATNVFRVLGKIPGILTLCFDIIKGAAPVWLAKQIYPDLILVPILTGLACIIGHIWTIFLKFKGGKGVATSAGVFLILTPLPTLISILLFSIIFFSTGYVSLGSIIAAIALPLLTVFFHAHIEIFYICLLTGILIIIRHISNIQLLFQGKERKLFKRNKNI